MGHFACSDSFNSLELLCAAILIRFSGALCKGHMYTSIAVPVLGLVLIRLWLYNRAIAVCNPLCNHVWATTTPVLHWAQQQSYYISSTMGIRSLLRSGQKSAISHTTTRNKTFTQCCYVMPSGISGATTAAPVQGLHSCAGPASCSTLACTQHG